LTDNTSRFGTDLDNIDIKVPKKIEKEIEKRKKLEKKCPSCEAKIHSACFECPECGYQFTEMEYKNASAPELSDVRFGQSEPETWNVTWVEWHRHTKKDKPDSVRIEYHYAQEKSDGGYYAHDLINGTKIASEWLCFEHGGYATQKAKEWWKKMHGDVPPETTTEAIQMLDSGGLKIPEQITTQKENGFKRVTFHWFSEKERRTESIEMEDVPF